MSDQPRAAREEGQFYVDVGNKIKELEAQLAAEREALRWEKQEHAKAWEQLAAEREARKVLGPTFTDEELGRWADEDAILKNQLAAELEKQIICPHCGWEFVDRMALEREESEKH